MATRPTGFDYPDSTALTSPDGRVAPAWSFWFSRVTAIANAAQQSGTTANRPTAVLWIGRQYWDTTLQKPVYVASVNPTVWKDSAGVVV